MTGPVGIQEVARAAGVSVTTVSHALNGRGKVSADTRERVARVAEDLGYRPNRVASALRSRRTGVLGFVSDEIASTPFAGRIVLGAQDAAAELDVILMVVNSNRHADVERRQIEALRAQQADGLLYATMVHRRVRAPGGFGSAPVVLVNATDADAPVPSIEPDEHQVGVDAARLLLDHGHRRIAHLTIADPGPATDGRAVGFGDAMVAASIAPRVVVVRPDADAAAGRAAFRRALEQDPSTSAVFAFNDQMAMGVYQVAAERGLRIPEDLSVVGVDNLELVAGQLLPPLTTFELPHYEMGKWAVRQAVRRLADPDLPVERLRLDCSIVARRSVGRRV